jgi:hypothetical protein
MMTFEILTIIVLVNIALTIGLLRTAARRPEKLKKKFRKQLWESKPITPKHERPPTPEKSRIFFGDVELQFFNDFEDFADVVNFWLTDPHIHPHNSPWRLQELPKSELSLWAGVHGPTYGRTYAVFHNQVRLGEIEIKPDRKYSSQNPRVTAHIELDWVRLLHFETIRSFLTDIATHVSEYRPGKMDYVQANQEIDRAMTSVLWNALKAPQYSFENEPSYDAQIEMELTGSANFYLDGRQYVRDQAAKAKQQN